MSKSVGIIDLGSNTFHLLICDVSVDTFDEVYRERIFVGLAEGGISTLKPEAIVRAEEAISAFGSVLDSHNLDSLRILGTAALRSADNASEVNEIVEKILGQPIEIIEGHREAELIYKGVALIANCDEGDHLIMDIGGGSTEFILIRDGNMTWSQSFNIGVAVLHEMFHKKEPIAKADIEKMTDYLDETLRPLLDATKEANLRTLIGASGSFEVVAAIGGDEPLAKNSVSTINIEKFKEIEAKITSANFAERAAIKGMPESRVKLIVMAMLLLRYVINHLSPDEIVVSPYALKEGLLSEMAS